MIGARKVDIISVAIIPGIFKIRVEEEVRI